MNTKPRKTAENHAPTVRKTMGGTVAKQQLDTTMTDNSEDNDSTETTDKDDTPTAYGVELDSVVAVAEAFAYLDDPWIVGDITVRTSEDCSLEDTVRTEEASSLEDLVIIQSRETHFGHIETLLEAQKQGHISIQHITTGTNRVGDPCLNIEVVGGNDSTETTDKDDTPTVNGVELDSVAGVANSLAYQIEADKIAADPAPERNGAEIRDAWAKISADPETTPTERNGAEIRDAWAKISADPEVTMTDNNADKHATLTEYLSAADNIDDSIDGAAKITHVRNGAGVWQTDDGERLEDDPDEYRVECSCGESFGSCGNAIRHAEEE
jgi:hypothetical protein